MSATDSTLSDLVACFVEIAPSVSSELVRTEGLVTRSQAKSHLNALSVSLTAHERELLAEALQYERACTLYDALSTLQAFCERGAWRLSNASDSVELSAEPYTLAERFVDKVEP